MRVIMEFVDDYGLGLELQNFTIAETGNTGFFLGYDSDMDESSGAEDPEAQAKEDVSALRAEAADRQRFLEAVQGALQCRAAAVDVERARMQLEDMRAPLARHEAASRKL